MTFDQLVESGPTVCKEFHLAASTLHHKRRDFVVEKCAPFLFLVNLLPASLISPVHLQYVRCCVENQPPHNFGAVLWYTVVSGEHKNV